jgi:predicted permease
MGNLLRDCKYSLRVLGKSPGFTILAILALALGIGANTAIFGIVNSVLLRPLPFEDSEKLVQVWHVPPQKIFPGVPIFVVSAANYLDWRKQNDVFENMAVFAYKNVNLTGKDEPVALVASSVSADFFPVLRKRALLGRVFTPEEDEPGHSDVVVLGNNLWRTTFGSSKDIIGQKITLDDHAYTVIGVMEPGLEFPRLTQLWLPLAWTDKDRAVRSSHDFQVIARLKPGATIKQAQAEMATISQRLEQQYPTVNTGWGATVVSLRDQTIGNTREALLVLLGAVGFVLLIACANVANLMLARILGRQKEIALRTALGARAGRVLQQILSESIILGLAGGVLGLFIAWSGIHLVADFLAQNVPRSTEITLDANVMIFTFGISILAGSLAGIIPGWLLTRTNINEALKQGLSRVDSGSGGGRIRNGLVVAEVALPLCC